LICHRCKLNFGTGIPTNGYPFVGNEFDGFAPKTFSQYGNNFGTGIPTNGYPFVGNEFDGFARKTFSQYGI
jgi:hypothetical protein